MWKPVIYDQGFGDFTFFTKPVVGGKDRLLEILSKKRFFWTKKILLRPISGNGERTFFIAFRDKSGKCKYWSELRTIKEGSFYILIGPEDCEFFLISQLPIQLVFEKYHRIKRRRYDLY